MTFKVVAGTVKRDGQPLLWQAEFDTEGAANIISEWIHDELGYHTKVVPDGDDVDDDDEPKDC